MIDPDHVIKDPAEIVQGNLEHFIFQKNTAKKTFNKFYLTEVVIETVDLDQNLVIEVIERNAHIVKSEMNVNIQFHVLDQKVLLETHQFVKN